MIKVIIFDYDGVIVDSLQKVHEVYMTICDKLGKECPRDLRFDESDGHRPDDSHRRQLVVHDA